MGCRITITRRLLITTLHIHLSSFGSTFLCMSKIVGQHVDFEFFYYIFVVTLFIIEKLLSQLCSTLTAQFLDRPFHTENCNFFPKLNQFYVFMVHCSHVRNIAMTILFCWLNGCLVIGFSERVVALIC